MSESLFEQAIELLLSQQVICEMTHPTLHRYLQDDDAVNKVTDFLFQIGRGMARTEDGNGVYCVFKHLGGMRKKSVQSQFDKQITQFEPLVKFLRLSRSISADARPLVFSDTLKESDLLCAIEDSTTLQGELDVIYQNFRINKSSDKANQKLRAILKHLTEHGFLHKVDDTGSVFKCTAKWSLFYDQLAFIQAYENVAMDEEDDARISAHADEQQGALSLELPDKVVEDGETARDE